MRNVIVVVVLLLLSTCIVRSEENCKNCFDSSFNITNITDLVVKSYLPTVYVVASGTEKGGITYGGGARWKTSDYGGVGLEYRQFQPRINFNRREYRMRGNAASAYLFLQSPTFHSFSIGADAGGGVLWDNTTGLSISETWVASARLNVGIQLGQYFDLIMFIGGHRIGSFTANDGRQRARTGSQVMHDGGIALRFDLGHVSENIQRYLLK